MVANGTGDPLKNQLSVRGSVKIIKIKKKSQNNYTFHTYLD